MNNREIVRDFYGRVIGTIETDRFGNKIVRDFYGVIKGRYDKRLNITRDFRGRKVASGDYCTALLDFNRR